MSARQEIEWLKGKSATNPGGSIYAWDWVVHCKELSKDCWDTAPHAWKYSEWGNAAGMTD